jgi:hypothetical protein
MAIFGMVFFDNKYIFVKLFYFYYIVVLIFYASYNSINRKYMRLSATKGYKLYWYILCIL